MNWILWREYRQHRAILITGAVLLVFPYLVVLLGYASNQLQGHASNWQTIQMAAEMSLMYSQLTLLLFAGSAIAGERADRSAEFLAYLPLAKSWRLAGKLLVAATLLLIIWGVTLGVAWTLKGPATSALHETQAGFFVMVAAVGLALFGVAWLASSLLSSSVYAVLAGLLAPLLLMVLFRGVDTMLFAQQRHHGALLVNVGFPVTCALVGASCFVAGTLYFLNRVEP